MVILNLPFYSLSLIISFLDGVITALAMDSQYTVTAFISARIKVFSTQTGECLRMLSGKSDTGDWAMSIVSAGGRMIDPNVEYPPALRPDVTRFSSPEGQSLDPRLSTADSTTSILGFAIGKEDAPRSPLSPRSPQAQVNGRIPLTSDPACASMGWGQEHALLVSGGSDRMVKVWDLKTGYANFRKYSDFL
jgi:WD40 repeat protein